MVRFQDVIWSGVRAIVSEAAEGYRLAAAQGDVEAHRKLGEICRRGRNYTEAAKWFQRAAELGDEIAQRRLAAMYHRGEGMAKDHSEAAKWVYEADRKRKESTPRSSTLRRSMDEPSTWHRRSRSQRYTEAEITLCTYIARFGRRFIDEQQIRTLFGSRSVSSIRMKVSNIAHMLNEERFAYSPEVSPLSGKPPGEQGRRTNWEMVRTLVELTEPELKMRVTKILSRHT